MNLGLFTESHIEAARADMETFRRLSVDVLRFLDRAGAPEETLNDLRRRMNELYGDKLSLIEDLHRSYE